MILCVHYTNLLNGYNIEYFIQTIKELGKSTYMIYDNKNIVDQ